jgi:hypothetical protein
VIDSKSYRSTVWVDAADHPHLGRYSLQPQVDTVRWLRDKVTETLEVGLRVPVRSLICVHGRPLPRGGLMSVVQVDEVTLDGRLLSSTGPDIAEGGARFLTAAEAARVARRSSLAVEERPCPARCREKAARQPGFTSPRARPARAGRLQGCWPR